MILFFGTLMGRAALAGVLIASLLGWRAYDVTKQRHVGVENERARVEDKGKKTDAKAKTARARAELQPHDSLRAYYRD